MPPCSSDFLLQMSDPSRTRESMKADFLTAPEGTLARRKIRCENKGTCLGRSLPLRTGLACPFRPRSLAPIRGASRKTLIAVILLCAAVITCPVPGIAQNANATSTGVSTCSPTDVSEAVSTSQQSYGPGVVVVMKSSVRNTSSKTCAVAVGPTSPSLTVTNSRGVVVWNNCYASDQPGACALYLIARMLKPGATYAETFAWDQRSGQSRARVPRGTYQLTSQFSSISGNRATRFQLTTTTSPRSITVTEADNGRSYSLHEGDRLFIQLMGPAIYTWSEPVSSNGAVLELSVGSPGNIATATFVARSTGQARVTAVGNPSCYPQCLAPSRLFVLTVSVVK